MTNITYICTWQGGLYLAVVLDLYSRKVISWSLKPSKLYTTKTPITAADLLNDRVLPFYESQGLPMLRILTDRSTEYCSKVEHHDYELYLALNDIGYTKTKVASPQTNEICERFHKTILQEFYQITFRKKLYSSLEELQLNIDGWLKFYNTERNHQGKV